MSLKFVSAYPNATINISIFFYSKECADLGHFVKQGWWLINDGETTEPYTGNLADQGQFFFFAQATDGHTWSGSSFYEVPQAHFNQCLLDNTNCDMTVGYDELDIGKSGSKTVLLYANGWEFYDPPSSSGGSGWDSGGGWDDSDDDDDGWGDDDDDDDD